MLFAVAIRAAVAVSLAMFQFRPVNTNWDTTMIAYSENGTNNATTTALLLREELLWAQQGLNCTSENRPLLVLLLLQPLQLQRR
jgi:hypothetical protein